LFKDFGKFAGIDLAGTGKFFIGFQFIVKSIGNNVDTVTVP